MQRPPEPPLDRVLFDRDEGAAGLYRGMKISVFGTWLNDDLLAEATRAVHNAAQDHPEGLAILCTLRPDIRFPLTPDFASNFASTARTLKACLPHLRACACVPMFDGFIATTAKLTVNALDRVVRSKIPQRIFSSRVEAVSWLATAVPERRASVRDDLLAAAAVDRIFERRLSATRGDFAGLDRQ
jgi:hypothetical protein